jgi:hypothetical protein
MLLPLPPQLLPLLLLQALAALSAAATAAAIVKTQLLQSWSSS